MINPLFHQLNSICKNKTLLSRSYIEEHYVGKYILLRFISFIDVDITTLATLLPYINSLNYNTFDDKYDEYLYLYYTIPKLPNVNFSYVKKTKVVKDDAALEKKIIFLAESLEISRKDAKYLIDEGYINLKQL